MQYVLSFFLIANWSGCEFVWAVKWKTIDCFAAHHPFCFSILHMYTSGIEHYEPYPLHTHKNTTSFAISTKYQHTLSIADVIMHILEKIAVEYIVQFAWY